MNSAKELFEKLTSSKSPDDSGKSPQQRLIEYCTQVLGAVERQHVDFKEKDRNASELTDNDKKNLSKAVSGFANSSGGVLIWGIEDETLSPKPITDVQGFVSSMLELAARVTDPVVQGIDGDWIPSDEGTGQNGFGLLYVPESSLPPHRVILNHKAIKNYYYIRSGESFLIASHTQLEDMFGRRPRPVLSLSTRIVLGGKIGSNPYCPAMSPKGLNDYMKVRDGKASSNTYYLYVILGIENKGRGVAKSPFLSVKIHPPYGIHPYGIDGNEGFGLKGLASFKGSDENKYGSQANTVIHSGTVHDVTAVKVPINVMESPYNVFDLVVDYKIAAEGTQLTEGQAVIRGKKLWDELNRLT
jgi:hypothetical protein